MTPPTHAAMPDISADPFRERRRGVRRATFQLLGARLVFESESAELMRLVDWAYAGLPRHTLSARVPRLAVRLVLGGNAGSRKSAAPAPLATSSGVGILCGASPKTSMAAVCPAGRSALVVVERELLRFPYHLRYELIEFAVFTLVARAQNLMPLHAACVGSGGRGLLLLGASGAGKSTAMLHCALAGMHMISEDSLFVTPDTLRATGVAELSAHSPRVASLPAGAAGRRAASLPDHTPPQRRGEIGNRPQATAFSSRAPTGRAGRRGGAALAECRSRSVSDHVEIAPAPCPSAGHPAVCRRPAGLAAVLAGGRRTLPAFELSRGRHPNETVQVLRQLLRDLARGGS